MRRLTLTSGWTELQTALRDFRLRWEETTPFWNDVVRREFEEESLKPLEEQVQSALRSAERLNQVLSEMQSDCG